MFGRTWMITGVCGTIGQELLKKVLELEPSLVVGIDNNESEVFLLYDKYRRNRNLKFYAIDIRDTKDVEQRLSGCEIVLHVAAAKHVLLCEEAPSAAIRTNIIGTQNMIELALRSGVEKFAFTSSDKAVNPTNVMGSSKLMAERLVSAANAQTRRGKQIFASTRFGNVLGSRGSVIPVFMRQIQNGGPLTVTDPEMTRFIMSKSEAARLVMDSTFLAQGGEIFVTKMPVVRIGDLAEVMVEEFAGQFGHKPSDIPVEIIGPRAGEKRYEELMNEEEIHRCIELPRYFAVKPAILSNFREIDYAYPGMLDPRNIDQGYNSRSETLMSKEELRQYLNSNPDLFENPDRVTHSDFGRRRLSGLADGDAFRGPGPRCVGRRQLFAPPDGARDFVRSADAQSRSAHRGEIFTSLTGKKITVRIGDLADYNFAAELFQQSKPDVVVHYAEQPSAPYSMMGRRQAQLTLRNNLDVTLNCVWAAIEHARDCHIVKLGTMGEYGTPNIDIEEGWIEIEHKGRKDKFLYPRAAGSLYHTTKVLDTDLLWFYVRLYGLRVTDLMQGPVYGLSTDESELDERLLPNFHYDDIFGTVVNRFVVQAVAGIPLTVYGKGGQVRGYLNLRDTLQCLDLAVRNPADAGQLRIYNQFSETFSVNDLAERVARVGHKLVIPWRSSRSPIHARKKKITTIIPRTADWSNWG